MKHSQLLIIFISSLLLITGCSSEPKPSAKVTSLGSRGFLVEGEFEDSGKFISKKNTQGHMGKVFVVSEVNGVDIEGIKKVEATITNRTEKTVNIEYRFFWYDASGMDMNGLTDVWHPITLEGKSDQTLSSVAKTPMANYFKLYVRKLPYRKR